MNGLKKRILSEIMTYKGFRKQSQLAKFLDISPQTLNKWFMRDTFDMEILLKKLPEISLDFLLYGHQPMLKKFVKVEPDTKEQDKMVPAESSQNSEIEYSMYKELDQKNLLIDQLIKQQDKLIEENKEMRKQIGMLLEKLVTKLD